MVYQRREYPEWSWSFSRSRLLVECKRKYYYHYYAAHNGWERSSPQLARQAYRLKKLTNLHFVFGDALHQAARLVVQRMYTDPVPIERLTELVREKLNGAYRSSRNRQRWMESPNRYPMLSEFYYGEGPSQTLVERIKARIPVCLENLLAAKTMRELEELAPAQILENDDAQPFEYSGTKVYAIADLVYRSLAGQTVIVDWKSGQDAEEHAEQVALYGLYVKLRHGWSQPHALARIEYLERGTCEELVLDRSDLFRAETLIEDSTEHMKSLLADPERNRPLGAEHFPLTESRQRCRWCNFLELCEDALAQQEKSG